MRQPSFSVRNIRTASAASSGGVPGAQAWHLRSRRGVVMCSPCIAGRGVRALDVILDQLLKFFGDALALERRAFFAIDINGGDRSLARAGQADADVGVLALAGTVHDTAHDGHRHLLDADVTLAPLRHAMAQ